MTLMFRAVHHLEAVHSDGKLVFPRVPGENTPGQKKKKQLDAAAKLWWNGKFDEECLKKATEIRDRVKMVFSEC